MLFIENIIDKKIYLFIVLVYAFLIIPFTGNVHLFDWDEINFAECAREMIVTNQYHTVLLNYHVFWEKPPLFIWMQVASMKVFGINEFAARFPNILNGALTLCLLYYFGKKWYSKQFGLLWASIHLGSMLPHLYFRSGIIDPWYNLFAFVAYIGIIEIIKNFQNFSSNQLKRAVIAGIFLGLSVLTKGPAMILIVLLSAFILLFLYRKNINIKHIKYFGIIGIIFLFVGGSWFLYEILSGNIKIVKAFIDYQIRLFKTEDSGHSGFLLYHFVIILLGCFPASVIFLTYFSKKTIKDIYSQAMMIIMFVVLVIFSIVRTKIVHYSSMSYYSVSFLATYVLVQKNEITRWQKYLMRIIGFLTGIIIVAAGSIEYWKHLIIPYIKDKFAMENLSVNVQWYGWEFLLGLAFIVIIMFYPKQKRYFTYYFLIIALWISLVINNFTAKVEQYTQNSAITFFKWCADKHYAVDTYGYKSYAYLFYGNRMPLNNAEKTELEQYLKNYENAGYDRNFSYNLAYLNWLIYSNKYPVYLVSKIQEEENVLKTKRFKKMYSKGGYVFYVKAGH